MSWEIVRYVRDDVELPYGEKLLLLTLATYTCRHNIAWPSIPRLAKNTGMAERSIHRILARLRRIHMLHVCQPQRRGHGNRYVIVTPDFTSGLHICTPDHRCQKPLTEGQARDQEREDLWKLYNNSYKDKEDARAVPDAMFLKNKLGLRENSEVFQWCINGQSKR